VSQSRRVLIVEDSPDDAELTVRALRRGACALTYHRVDTPEAMRRALEEQDWDIVIADYSMPRFTGLAALKMLQKAGLDVPFILVSGTVGEEVAVEAMKCGADDYVLKSNLARLPLAVERELRDYVNIAEVWLRQEERARLKAIIDQVGVVKNFEMEIRRPDGSVIWCEQSARAVYDAAGKVAHYEGVLVDITYRKRAEDEANRARDRVRDLALETARLRSEFLASMSHEIRTPLVGIIGTGELLSRSDLTAEQGRLIEIIRSSGELLLTVVNDILDFSKLAAGRVVLEKLDFDLVELTENLIDSFAVAARAKGIELALYVDANVPTGLRGDPSRLRQILNNLVANAIKFTERGDVTVRASTVESTAGHALVRFEVVDTGIGIPDEAQARLFQPFVQAEGSTGRRFGGTGLGLVIAAKLIEQMGGEIGFESAPERGSNFHFTARFGRGSEIVHPWMSATAISCFKAMRAMVVNDSPALRQVISEYLTSWGVENAAVGSGAEALAILKRWTAGGERQVVVLIDEQTPDMGALTLTRAIKDHFGGRHSKVIMFSAETGGRSASEAVDAWITKPVRPSHLFSCILELCGNTNRSGVEKIAAAPLGPIANEQPQWRKAVRVLLVDDNLVNRIIGAKQLSALGYTAEIAARPGDRIERRLRYRPDGQ